MLHIFSAEGEAIQAALADKTGQRTVPNVFINGNHVGGCDDTLKLHADNNLMAALQSSVNQSEHPVLLTNQNTMLLTIDQ